SFDFARFDPNWDPYAGGRGVTFGLGTNNGSQRLGQGLADDGSQRTWTRIGSTWTHVNRVPDRTNSSTKMTITDRGAERDAGTVTGKNGPLFFPITAGNLPLQARVILGVKGGAAMLGHCGELEFAPAGCKLSAAGTAVTCNK